MGCSTAYTPARGGFTRGGTRGVGYSCGSGPPGAACPAYCRSDAPRGGVGRVEAACQARLLVEEMESYRFAYDVIREVVVADLGAVRRKVLCQQVAEALVNVGAG